MIGCFDIVLILWRINKLQFLIHKLGLIYLKKFDFCAFFIFFFHNMERMAKLFTPPFLPKQFLTARENFPPPRVFGLHIIWVARELELLSAWCRKLGSAYTQHKGQSIQFTLLAKQQIALLWEVGKSQLAACSLMDTIKRRGGFFSLSQNSGALLLVSNSLFTGPWTSELAS